MLRDFGRHIVSVLLINVAESDTAQLVREAESLMKHKGDLAGFVEGEIFQSEDRSRFLIITEWTSLHDWSMSQWDRDVSENLVSIAETARAIDSRTYYRVARIPKDESED
jgi:heme-degrading monooxygenase HmoA